MKVKTKRRPRLKLSAADRVELKRLKQEKLTARVWRRILTLEHLDAGQTVRGAAKAVGGYHREVKRVADRYNAAGLQAALSDEPRPGPERKLDSVEEAAVVAMVCGPPPEGYARWTIRQCIGKRRIPDLRTLVREVRAWRRVTTREGMPIRWRFRVKDARRTFRYERLESRRSND